MNNNVNTNALSPGRRLSDNRIGNRQLSDPDILFKPSSNVIDENESNVIGETRKFML